MRAGFATYIMCWHFLFFSKKFLFRGAWVAQSVKHLILDFSLGHGLKIVRWNPESGSTLSVKSALDSLSPSLSLPLLLVMLACSLSLSFKINKH